MRWWRWTVAGWSGVAVVSCLWLSGWVLLLLPRAVDAESNPFPGTGALLLGAVALAVVAAGALFARGGVLLHGAPPAGRAPRAAYRDLALGGALVCLPSARWLWCTATSLVPPDSDASFAVLVSDRLGGPIFPALWLEWSGWLVAVGLGVCGVVGWWWHARRAGDRDAEVAVRAPLGRAPAWAAAGWLLATGGLGVSAATAWAGDPGRSVSIHLAYEEWVCGTGMGGGTAAPPVEEQRAATRAATAIIRGNLSPVGRLLRRYDDRVNVRACAWGRFCGQEFWGPANAEQVGFPVDFGDTRCGRAVRALSDTAIAAGAVPALLRLFEEGDALDRSDASGGLARAGRWSDAVVPAMVRYIHDHHARDARAEGVARDPIADEDLGWDLAFEYDPPPPGTILALRVVQQLAKSAERADARAALMALVQHESRWLRAAALLVIEDVAYAARSVSRAPVEAWSRVALTLAGRDRDPAIAGRAREVLEFIEAVVEEG